MYWLLKMFIESILILKYVAFSLLASYEWPVALVLHINLINGSFLISFLSLFDKPCTFQVAEFNVFILQSCGVQSSPVYVIP
jgi:hypothetical protein